MENNRHNEKIEMKGLSKGLFKAYQQMEIVFQQVMFILGASVFCLLLTDNFAQSCWNKLFKMLRNPWKSLWQNAMNVFLKCSFALSLLLYVGLQCITFPVFYKSCEPHEAKLYSDLESVQGGFSLSSMLCRFFNDGCMWCLTPNVAHLHIPGIQSFFSWLNISLWTSLNWYIASKVFQITSWVKLCKPA